MSTIIPAEDLVAEGASDRSAGLMALLVRDPLGLFGAVLVALMFLAALAGPSLAPFDPDEIHILDQLAAPNATYWLGTDELGRDLLSRLLHGARVSLTVGLVSVGVASIPALLIGLVAGYYGGWRDILLMRFLDILFAFPAILLALIIIAVLGTELRFLMLALVIIFIPDLARIVRGTTLSVCSQEYILAAVASGSKDTAIILQHILPNISGPLLVQVSVNLAYAILVEAALSFLGLGVQPPTPSWGAMLSTGKAYMELSPWIALFPGLAIMISVLGFNLLGDGLRDILDPRR